MIRELIGYGTVFGAAVLSAGYEPRFMAAAPAGGFLIAGICLGIANIRSAGKKEEKEGSEG